MSADRVSRDSAASNKQKLTLSERDRLADEALSTRYDALNMTFTTAEQHLKALKPLHPVWLQYELELFDGGNCELLGLCKYQGKWRLCHAMDHDSAAGGLVEEIKPIVECAVDVRVRAAKVVRKLREKIVKSKEEYIPQVDAAIEELSKLCSEI